MTTRSKAAARGRPVEPAGDSGIPRGWAWLLLALAALLWFGTLGYRHLIHPDEGRYAELARAMVTSGDWITPRLNGILYFEKPALQYWATALSFTVFGIGEASARLWPALTGALAVAALAWTARRALASRAALASACVLGSSVWWIGNGHFLNLDMGLAAAMTLALLGFWTAQRDEASQRERLLGMLTAWAAMALAVLSKGLIGVVLPGAVLVVYTVVARDFVIWRRMQWLGGLALFLAIAAPWFIAMSLRNPDFAHFFFVHEHFERFLSTQHRRTAPWWYFAPILALGLMPWTTLLPGALAAGWRRQPGRFQPNRLFVVWAAVIFLFFSASSSKLSSYILPVFPALALLIGQRLADMPARRIGAHALVAAALAATVAAVLLAAPGFINRSAPDGHELAYRNWLLAACATLGLGALLSARFAAAGARTAAVVSLAFAGLAGTQLAILGHQVFAQLKSARIMVETIRGAIDPAAPFYSVQTHDQTLPFYLGRSVTLVDWTDEFATGIRIEPQRQIPTVAEFESLWRARPGAVAMMRAERYAEFERDGLPMRIVYRDPQRVVVVRP